jgi:phosphatidylinositol alpha-mannosyltransferase
MRNQGNRLSVGFLYDDTLDSTDGVAQYVKTLGSWLANRGHTVSYLVGETKTKQFAGGQVHSLSSNAGVVFNGNRVSIPAKVHRGKIKGLLAALPIDILHVQVPYSPLMAQYVINHAPASTAIIGTFHIYPASRFVELGTRILRLVVRKSLRRFNLTVSVSQPAAEFAKRVFGIQTKVMPNVIDPTVFASPKDNRFRKKDPHVVFLGRLVRRKGCLDLLKSFAILHQSLPQAKLTIAGDGPQRPVLDRYVNNHNLEQAVNFLGYIDEKDKPSLLASADIACFPSLYGESFGIVLLEAMASGAKVVLGGDNPGYTSVLGEREEHLVDPRNHQQFAARLRHFLTDKTASKRASQWQKTQINKYDVATVGPQIEKEYFRAIAIRNGSRHN